MLTSKSQIEAAVLSRDVSRERRARFGEARDAGDGGDARAPRVGVGRGRDARCAVEIVRAHRDGRGRVRGDGGFLRHHGASGAGGGPEALRVPRGRARRGDAGSGRFGRRRVAERDGRERRGGQLPRRRRDRGAAFPGTAGVGMLPGRRRVRRRRRRREFRAVRGGVQGRLAPSRRGGAGTRRGRARGGTQDARGGAPRRQRVRVPPAGRRVAVRRRDRVYVQKSGHRRVRGGRDARRRGAAGALRGSVRGREQRL